MKKLYNDPSHKELRRHLRKKSTTYERALWDYLRGRRLGRLKFRRQYGVDRYVLDFYCPKLRLAIEIDGPIHEETGSRVYDRERDAFLQAHNIHVLRFTNEELKTNLAKVIHRIEQYDPPPEHRRGLGGGTVTRAVSPDPH
jgi:very-short-patch-repair endonuclease